tara:strand:- start:219 stop:887 length:669 start_codon:yes stop_codon:yes gene_type:complete
MEKNSLLYFPHIFSSAVYSVFAFNPDRNTCYSIAHQVGFFQDSLSIPQQIHSARVKWIDAPGEYSGVDGLITSKTDLILTLKVADCVPVYFFDPQNNMIGLVHSGWRGTVGGIIINTIKLMQKYEAEIGKILVYMGPAIGGCCYEVDTEISDLFYTEAKSELDDRKWKVDLHKQIRLQLIESGISVANIHASDICTFETSKCHSYRRDGSEAGRMYAFMGMK